MRQLGLLGVGLWVVFLAALGSQPASASMIMAGTSGFGALSFSGEGNSYTHFATPGNPASGVTGSSQEYFLTSVTPSLLLPDPQNYGLQISKGILDPAFPGVTALDHDIAVVGDFDWAISYYSPAPATIGGSPFHSVLYGTTTNELLMFDPANDGPGGIQDIAYGSATLNYDGLYYGVNFGPFATMSTTLELTVTLYEVGINGDGQNEWSTEPIPEPGTLVLMFAGLAGLAARPRGKRAS